MPGATLNPDELIKLMGPAVREPLRKDLQEDLKQQTREFQHIVAAHERHDDEQFTEITRQHREIFHRQNRIEVKLSRWGGMAAAMLIVIPIIWDLFKAFVLKFK